jgi:acyl-CoA synthetase (AMP-forming)/AMP-acid ligase II
MKVLDKIKERWKGVNYPFLIHSTGSLNFTEIAAQKVLDLSNIKSGEVVALIGDFDPQSIMILLELIDKNTIIVPLTKETKPQHNYFLESAFVDVVIEGHSVRRIKNDTNHKLIDKLRSQEHAGLVLFSTGTTGSPKAILHDLTIFMQRFETPRPTFKTISFLLFDHIGGLNTLLHTLFNKGTVIAPESRSVEVVLKTCKEHQIEVLPTTPTFLRMMLISGLIPDGIPESLRIITYGTERMDQPTLDALCELLPNVDFRQTFGMSELGIFRVKSKARNSLYMKIGGEGIETRVVNKILEIRSQARMLGYLNADSPFNNEGWYNTKDIVEECDGFYKVIGRTSEVINVGGLKFMASDVERVVLQFEGIKFTKAEGKDNPITGQHVELTVQFVSNNDINKKKLKLFLNSRLPSHMLPKRIKVSSFKIGHRFKRV